MTQPRQVQRKLTRRGFLAGSLLLGGAALVACTPAAQPTTVPKEEATPAPKEAVTLKFHDRAGSHCDWHKKRETLFEQQNPGLKIEFDEIPGDHIAKQYALAASGTIGDIVWCYNNAATEAVRKGVPLPLNDIVAAEKFDTSVFWKTIISSYTVDGKLYGVPNHGHFGTIVYYHNEDMFKEAGVPLPTPTWTVEDLVAGAQKMTKAPDVWGLRTNGAAGEFMPSYLRMFGGEMFDPEGTKCLFDSAGSKAAIKWLYDLKFTYKVDPCICGDNTRDNFVAGKVGIYHWTPGYAAEFTLIKDWKFKWNAMVAPSGPSGARGSQVSGAAFCVTKASKHPTEAFQVLKFFSTLEDAVEHVWGGAGSPGARQDAWTSQRLNDFHPIYKTIMATYPDGPKPYYYPKNGRLSEFNTTEDAALQAIWTGKVGVDEGVAQLQKTCQEILDREQI